jgi:hypothetical protein
LRPGQTQLKLEILAISGYRAKNNLINETLQFLQLKDYCNLDAFALVRLRLEQKNEKTALSELFNFFNIQ